MTPKSVRAVERAIDVLDAIKAQGGAAGVTEISQALELAKSTVHRLLVALSNKGMVRQDEVTKRYSLGHKALELAFAASQHWDIISLAMPYLEDLRDRLGETAALAIKFGLKYAYVAQVVSLHEYRINPVLGKHYPLHWAATGKTILAHVTTDELEECLKVVPHSRATPRTVTDPELLLDQLEDLRRVGYSVSFGERSARGVAVAAPIRNRHGLAYAASCLIGPESRLRETDLEATGSIVADVSRQIEMACQAIGLGC